MLRLLCELNLIAFVMMVSALKPVYVGRFRHILSFGFGVAELVLVHLLAVLLVDGFSLVHTVIYDTHKQAHNKKKK